MIGGGAVGALLATFVLTGSDVNVEASTLKDVPEMTTPDLMTADLGNDAPAALALNATASDPLDEIADGAEADEEITVAAYVAPAAEAIEETTKTVSVNKGDTLMTVLTRAGVDRSESHEAITALNEIFDPRSLKVGQDITLYFGNAEDTESRDSAAPSLIRVALNEDVDRQLAAVRTPGAGFTPQETILELDKKMTRAGGVIDSSLFLSAAQAGIPTRVIVDMIRIFSYDVDFQREIQPGDSFEVYFERFADENGNILKDGSIVWASMTLSGKTITLYRFKTTDDGIVDYYDEKGQSVRKSLMRTPIDGARLTSKFGKRKHPVLGYTKMHRGADFGARTGTPIMAAGNGVVEFAGANGGYGNYVRIRHNDTYKTAYAHMSKFGKGIRKGVQVKQGQIIGYVGTTGRSTGPHLHYEVHKNGTQINPLSVKLPAGRKLEGKMLSAFNATKGKIEKEVASADMETRLVAKLKD
mgnify:CR=1 FL=1